MQVDLFCIQSARLSFQSSESGPPLPHPQGSAVPPPFGSKGEDKPACGGGGGPNAMMKNPSHAAVPLNPSKARDVGRSQQWQLQTPLFCSTKSPHQIQKTFWLPRRNFYPCSPPPLTCGERSLGWECTTQSNSCSSWKSEQTRHALYLSAIISDNNLSPPGAQIK
jgi:hypothetical protein